MVPVKAAGILLSDSSSAGEFDKAFGDGDGGVVSGLAEVEAEKEAGAGLLERHDWEVSSSLGRGRKASSIASGSK